MSYMPEHYELEKLSGERLPNGAKPLRKLSPRHIELVKAHLDGVPNKDLARMFNMTESTVSRILNDPLVIELRKQHFENVGAEFDALYQKAVAAIRDGLSEAEPAGTRLKAAQLWFERARERSVTETETAEDVAKRLIAIQLNINTNSGEASPQGGSDEATNP